MIGALFAVWLATAPAAMLGCPDADGDGVCDAVDNCPAVPNPNQAIPVKLSGPMTTGGNVGWQDMSADGQRVVYLADQDTDNVEEIYSVPLAGGPVTKLNAPLVTNGGIYGVVISPDSARVVYRADQDVEGLFELYSVPTGGGPVVQLSAVPPLGDVATFAVSPDGSRVVYHADQETDNVVELYSVPIGGGTIVKLSTGGYVSDSVISVDGSRVLYRSTSAGSNPNLFSVPIAGGPSVQLNGPLVAGGSVEPAFYGTSPDGALTLYRADQDVDARIDLYSVPTTGGTPTNLTSSFPATSDCGNASFSPDGSTVLFAESGTGGGLYVTPATGGPLTLLTSSGGGGQFSPDGQHVVFQVGLNGWVYTVPASGGTPVRLNGKFFGTGGPRGIPPASVQEIRVTPDSSRVVYRRPLGQPYPDRLYSAPTPGGLEVRIDGSITEAYNYVLVPADGSRVVFAAVEPSVTRGLFLTSTAGSTLVYNLTPAIQIAFPDVPVEVDPSGTVATYVARTAPSSVYELYRVSLTVDAAGVDRDRDGAGGACDPGDHCGDFDGDGLDSCAGDCNDFNSLCLTDCTDTDGDLACDPQDCAAANPGRYPGAPEVNNGADEQCPGDPGYGAIDEVTGPLVFNTPTLICWTPQSGATDYELAQASDLHFTASCTTTALVGNCDEVFDPPAPILYYLVRATAPNAGSWGQTSAGVERVVSCP